MVLHSKNDAKHSLGTGEAGQDFEVDHQLFPPFMDCTNLMLSPCNLRFHISELPNAFCWPSDFFSNENTWQSNQQRISADWHGVDIILFYNLRRIGDTTSCGI
jgi:hypothetical protein